LCPIDNVSLVVSMLDGGYDGNFE
ncbi:MAG: hypothetical protein QOJ56_1967, partial [Mycobacterium sp.]|nr:hypothetical protein [Mycobacterium sp.]